MTFQQVGILALILDVAAIGAMFRTPADGATRVTWTFFILLLPFIGAIFYFGMSWRRPAVGWNPR
jgi:hypothetical protein